MTVVTILYYVETLYLLYARSNPQFFYSTSQVFFAENNVFVKCVFETSFESRVAR
jgi:hypothetical protein